MCLTPKNVGNALITRERLLGIPQVFMQNMSYAVKRENQPSVIPAQAGSHATNRHSSAGGKPCHKPSFQRRREAMPQTVIPAQAGIQLDAHYMAESFPSVGWIPDLSPE